MAFSSDSEGTAGLNEGKAKRCAVLIEISRSILRRAKRKGYDALVYVKGEGGISRAFKIQDRMARIVHKRKAIFAGPIQEIRFDFAMA